MIRVSITSCDFDFTPKTQANPQLMWNIIRQFFIAITKLGTTP